MQKKNRKGCVEKTINQLFVMEKKMNRFAFISCSNDSIGFVIPEINLRGSESTENIDDVISFLVNRYNVGEYEVV